MKCEECDHEGPPSDFVMFQGEVALCSSEAACRQRIRDKRRDGRLDIDRKVHEFYAKSKGYFWLPCPFPGCGRMYGGHECGSYTIRDKDNPSLGTMTCRLHDEFAVEMFNLRNPGAEWHSSTGRLSYWGFPEVDMRYREIVSEFRQRVSGDDRTNQPRQ